MTTARPSLLRFAARALVAGAALSPAAAAAQPADSMAVAEALFQQARDLVKQERYAEACPKLAESQRLEPKLGTLLNLAVCNEKLGKTATAWAEYTSAAAIARREGRKDREDFARDQVAALEKKLSHVILQVAAPDAALSLTWDDQPLAGAVIGTPLPADPGKHRVAASAPGKVAWSTVVDVPIDRQDILVPIPALEAAPVTPVTPPPVAPVAPPPAVGPVAVVPAPVPAPQASGSGSALVYVGFTVGGAGVLVGAITGVVTLVRGGDLRGKCGGNVCSADKQTEIDGATTIANVSNASFAVGAAGVVVGIADLLLARPAAAAPATRAAVTLTPVLGPGLVGLRGAF